MLIKDCCIINPKSSKNYDYINYIDTSSLLDGRLLNVQYLQDNFPSRAQREVEINDILISSVRPNLLHNGMIKSTIKNCIASTGFIHIRCNNNVVIPRYIYYLLTSNKNINTYIKIADSSQTTFPTFNKDVIENMQVIHKDISTQQHIVDTIGSVDDLIEKNEEIIEKINDYGNLLYKNIKCNNWSNILDIITFDKGTEIGSKNYIEKQDKMSIPYIRVGNLLNNQYDTFCYDDNYKTCFMDDILIAFDGAPGRNSIGLKGAYSSGIYKVACENKIKGYIYFYLNSDICQNTIKENSEGTTILHASKSIKLLKIQNINDEKQLELFNKLFENLVLLYKKQKYLKSIKQLLLNKYFD